MGFATMKEKKPHGRPRRAKETSKAMGISLTEKEIKKIHRHAKKFTEGNKSEFIRLMLDAWEGKVTLAD